MSISLLFVEDQPVIRSGMEALLQDSEVVVLDTATTTAEAVEKAASTQADVVLLDVRLAEGDGLAALARIKADRPKLPVIMYSGYDNPAFVARAVALGAAGYLLKGVGKDELLSAVRRAAGGETLWTREELRRVTSALATPRGSLDLEVPLTRREMEVLTRIVAGHTNKRIAEELKISYETVKEHVQHLLKKIGVSDRTQAAVWAVRSGVLA
ncbi:MAG: response regulator transcription factor [Pirellulaceae bacterium]